MGKDSKLKKLARSLMATTCLTIGAGAASGSTFLEPSVPGGDFSNILASPSGLTAGTNVVSGSIGTFALDSFDTADYFAIPGLVSGGLYTLTFNVDNFSDQMLRLYDGAAPYGGPFSSGASVTVTVPTDQNLVFGVLNSSESGNYTVTFNQNAPEPGTLGLAGLALGGALALRRRKKN